MAQSAFAAPPTAMASPKIHAMNDASLHEAIISGFLEHQRPPTILEIAERFQCDEVQARDALTTTASCFIPIPMKSGLPIPFRQRLQPAW